jgi:hypothetical protein
VYRLPIAKKQHGMKMTNQSWENAKDGAVTMFLKNFETLSELQNKLDQTNWSEEVKQRWVAAWKETKSAELQAEINDILKTRGITVQQLCNEWSHQKQIAEVSAKGF